MPPATILLVVLLVIGLYLTGKNKTQMERAYGALAFGMLMGIALAMMFPQWIQ